jgi:hypothetical protein
VPEEVLPHFKETASNIKNSKEMLARALAFMSGYKDTT